MTPEMSRICIFMPSFAGGGAERVMVRLANDIAARNHKVDLVVCGADGPFRADVSSAVAVTDLNAPRMIFSLPRLVRHLRRTRPNVVLSVLTHSNLVALLAVKLAGIRTRIVIGERNSLTAFTTGRLNAKRMLRNLLVRWLYPEADKILANSHAMRDEITTFLGGNESLVEVIFNPVPIGEIRAQAAQTPAHRWLRTKVCPVIVGAGRLSEQKDFATLLDAFCLVRAKRPAKLIVFGEGPERDALLVRASAIGVADDVELAGFTDAIFSALKHADVFALTSRWEGLPNVLLEALACETQIVSTDCPTGPAEILENGRWGRLCGVGDAKALAIAIGEALDNPIIYTADEALTRFDPQDVTSRYLAVLLNKDKAGSSGPT